MPSLKRPLAKLLFALAAGVALGFGSSHALLAKTAAAPGADAELARAKFQTFAPGAEIYEATALSAHLVEISSSEGIAYVSGDNGHIIVGSAIETRSGANITQMAIERAERVQWSSLPHGLALVHGRGSREVFVVSDPFCGYCRALHDQLRKIPDLKIHTLVAPILGRGSPLAAERVFCSADPAKAWDELMLRGQAPQAAGCEAGAKRSLAGLAAAHALGVKSTPVLFLRDGRRVSGALGADEIERLLSGQKI